MNDSQKPKVWTDEERLELAAKLDAELDAYIDGLEKKRYTEGWSEDRWQEEMEQHPFFMTKPPEAGEKLSPLMEGLQQLKYSTEENTPEELANNYKEDGTFNYKHKNYRLAIISYTEGIKTKCENPELMAQLYNNRAAAHFMLKNYRSCLMDCKNALKFKPDYIKALNRAAICALNIKDYSQCLTFCNSLLKHDPTDDNVINLRSQAISELATLERDKRKQQKLEKKQDEEEERLFKVIQNKKIKLELINNIKYPELKDLEPQIPQISQCRVHLDENNDLIWPIMFLYPETKQSDFVQRVHENTIMREPLENLFEEPPEWDLKREYKVDNINLYFEGKDKCSLHKVDINQTLSQILQHESLIVRGGTPVFLVFVRSSEAEKRFLVNY